LKIFSIKLNSFWGRLTSPSQLRVDELYLITLAIEADPAELLLSVCKEISVPQKWHQLDLHFFSK
jgi:hypothetical protein